MSRAVRVPGDKSLTHRALMLAALATGRSRIRGGLVGADTRSTAACLRRLGCSIPELTPTELIIEGVGLQGLRRSSDVLDCGNSGTTARLLMGILAGCAFAAELTGDASLCSRPMRRVTEPLTRMGAHFEELGASDRLPLRMRGGALRAMEYHSPHASAQVKSALLLAGLVGGVPVAVTEPALSRDHTERMLQRLGAHVSRSAEQPRVELAPVTHLDPLEFDVPGDFSSAAFLLAHACLGAGEVLLPGVGVNPSRTGFLDVLQRMQADVSVENRRESCGEPIADLRAAPSRLRAVRISAGEVPALIDEIPIIAVLAARAEGTTVIEGAGELRVKESDRITAIVSNLQTLGARAEELADGLVVHGSDQPLTGGVRTLHDHRIAMAFGVLGAAPENGITVDVPDIVDVSFPGFWQALQTGHS